MKAAPQVRKRTGSISDRILNHLETCPRGYLTPRELFKRLKLKPSRAHEFKAAIGSLLERGQIRNGVELDELDNPTFNWDCALYYNIKSE